MPLDRYICIALDAPLPDVEQYRSRCLFNWDREHPSARFMRHSIEVSNTDILHAGTPHHVGLIFFNVLYEE